MSDWPALKTRPSSIGPPITDRLLLTHDFKTIPRYAYERVRSGLPMPGVIICDVYFPVRDGIDEIQLIAECSHAGEHEGLVLFLPLTTAG